MATEPQLGEATLASPTTLHERVFCFLVWMICREKGSCYPNYVKRFFSCRSEQGRYHSSLPASPTHMSTCRLATGSPDSSITTAGAGYRRSFSRAFTASINTPRAHRLTHCNQCRSLPTLAPLTLLQNYYYPNYTTKHTCRFFRVAYF